MATALFSSSPQLIRRCFVLRCPVLSFLPSSVFIQTKQSLPRSRERLPSLNSTRLFFSPAPITEQLDGDVELQGFTEIEIEGGSSSSVAATAADAASPPDGLRKVLMSNLREITGKPPSLSVKEKKELASYAHSLGKKLKSQQVGKSGVTDTVVTALIETLEANELLKLKIHGSCPGELDDVVKQLEETTGSVVVGQIGRTVILYRPSLAKLKAEEKRKLAMLRVEERRRRAQRQPISKQSFPSKGAGQEQRQYGGGRRGRSRF